MALGLGFTTAASGANTQSQSIPACARDEVLLSESQRRRVRLEMGDAIIRAVSRFLPVMVAFGPRKVFRVI